MSLVLFVIPYFIDDKTEAQREWLYCPKVTEDQDWTQGISHQMNILSVLLSILKIFLAGFPGEGMSDLSADEPFPWGLSLDHVAQSRILVHRISFSMAWPGGLDLPPYLVGIFPWGRIYHIIKKFLHLQKDNGLCSVRERSNHDQISLTL